MLAGNGNIQIRILIILLDICLNLLAQGLILYILPLNIQNPLTDFLQHLLKTPFHLSYRHLRNIPVKKCRFPGRICVAALPGALQHGSHDPIYKAAIQVCRHPPLQI